MKDKQAMFDSAMFLLAMSDEGMETKQLKKAMRKIKVLIHVRENMPF